MRASTGESLGVLVERLAGPISLEVGVDGALYVLDREGVHRFETESGERLGTLVEARSTLQLGRSFTFVDRDLLRDRR